jgi:arylsulfatase A-like enzyme
MANVKSLIADQGVSFPNFFVSLPLCCPSRSTILRGQYAHNTGIFKNAPPDGGFQGFLDKGLEQSTIATWLQAAGYRTGLIGKYLNGYPGNQAKNYVPPGWDTWAAVTGDMGYYKYELNNNGVIEAHAKTDQDYLTDLIARGAEAFVRAPAQNKPFFLYLPVFAPHGPSIPARRHVALFPELKAPRTLAFNEADVDDKPEWAGTRDLLNDDDIRKIDAEYRLRIQSLQAVDEMVASLVRALEATGQLDNTYIFITSDNGWEQGEHRIDKGKQTPYEESIRVSMTVRGPNVPHGRTVDYLVGNVDLAPTFAELGRAELPGFVDGRSLVPLMRPNLVAEEKWRRGFLIELGAAKSATKKSGDLRAPELVGVRTREHLYVEYSTGEKELYDLRSDPYQLQNIAARAEAGLLSRLSAMLATLSDCAGDGCVRAEDGKP